MLVMTPQKTQHNATINQTHNMGKRQVSEQDVAPAVSRTFTVLKGVGVPAHWRNGSTIYPLDQLDVNDGFELDTAKARSAAAAARTFGKRSNRKFTVRRAVDENGNLKAGLSILVRTE